MTTYSQRVRTARAHAKLSQAELASRIGVKQQAIQYLENPKNKAGGSRHTSAIARECDVSAKWLEKGIGTMLEKNQAKAEEPSAEYVTLSTDAREVALAFDKMSPELREWIRDMIFMLAAVERHYPWLKRGRPKGETYDQYERRIEQNYLAKVQLAAARDRR